MVGSGEVGARAHQALAIESAPLHQRPRFAIVNERLKILCIVASIAAIGVVAVSVDFSEPAVVCDTITLTGDIQLETFLKTKDCLVQSSAKSKTFVVAESGGGSWEAALALGILIHRHGWRVEVVGLCASACANFIFPAGKTKYLHRESLLLFHGGPHQHNMMAKFIEAETASKNGVQVMVIDPEHAKKEGGVFIDNKAVERGQVLEFLSITNVTGAVDLMTRLTSASDQFYQDLGVNLVLPHYGQIGKYEPIYLSYKYGGFFYRLDSLERLGVHDIEVEGGEWHPERHGAYSDVYEVTYP